MASRPLSLVAFRPLLHLLQSPRLSCSTSFSSSSQVTPSFTTLVDSLPKSYRTKANKTARAANLLAFLVTRQKHALDLEAVVSIVGELSAVQNVFNPNAKEMLAAAQEVVLKHESGEKRVVTKDSSVGDSSAIEREMKLSKTNENIIKTEKSKEVITAVKDKPKKSQVSDILEAVVESGGTSTKADKLSTEQFSPKADVTAVTEVEKKTAALNTRVIDDKQFIEQHSGNRSLDRFSHLNGLPLDKSTNKVLEAADKSVKRNDDLLTVANYTSKDLSQKSTDSTQEIKYTEADKSTNRLNHQNVTSEDGSSDTPKLSSTPEDRVSQLHPESAFSQHERKGSVKTANSGDTMKIKSTSDISSDHINDIKKHLLNTDTKRGDQQSNIKLKALIKKVSHLNSDIRQKILLNNKRKTALGNNPIWRPGQGNFERKLESTEAKSSFSNLSTGLLGVGALVGGVLFLYSNNASKEEEQKAVVLGITASKEELEKVTSTNVAGISEDIEVVKEEVDVEVESKVSKEDMEELLKFEEALTLSSAVPATPTEEKQE